MNILMLIDSLSGGGAQKQFVNLAIGLDSRRHFVDICTYYPHDFQKPRLENTDIGHCQLKKNSRFDLRPVWQLSKLTKTQKADVVIAFLKTPSAYAEMARCLHPKIPLIVSERCGSGNSKLSFKEKIGYTGHKLATHVTTNSHDNRNTIINAVPGLADKSSVIYNGVETKFLNIGLSRTSNPTLSPNAQSLKHTTEPFRFCAIAARATENKGVFDLIHAAHHLKERQSKPFTIDWIGPTKPQQTVDSAKKLIAKFKLNTVWKWRGPVTQTETLLPCYDAFVLPSQVDGVANTLCEAMSCGLPIVATDVHDNQQILHNGNAGILCKPHDANDMAECMNDLISSSIETLNNYGQSAYQAASEQFQMERFLDQWETLCFRVSNLQPTDAL